MSCIFTFAVMLLDLSRAQPAAVTDLTVDSAEEPKIAQLILKLMEPKKLRNSDERKAQRLALIIIREARSQSQDPVVVTGVMRNESGFDENAIGAKGEVGLLQIKPDGRATRYCKSLLNKLREPWANIRCGVRLLTVVRNECGPDPMNYLGRYSGRACGPSGYARRVLARISSYLTANLFINAVASAP